MIASVKNIFTALLCIVAASSPAEIDFDADGATPGKWTMDFDAAKALAAEKQLPILLDFSGSDWCGWCKIMEESVFTKPEWQTYAQESLVMVLIDFPNDKSLVPDKYVERNKALKNEYGVRGYPTFVVLDDDGTTELGRLRSGRDKTPASFQEELAALFRFRSAEALKYVATLSQEDQVEYRNFMTQLSEQKDALKQREEEAAEARKKVRSVQSDIQRLEIEMRKFRVAHLPESERKEYEQLRLQNSEAKVTFQEWMKSKPEPTEENREKYQTMQAEIKELEEKMAQY